MSINPRTALAWLLGVALMAACSPALAKGPGGGGGGVHGMSGFHSGFSGGSFAHPSFSSGNFSHNWSMGTPHVAFRTGPGTIHTVPCAAQRKLELGKTTRFHTN